jgi:hypothetical protein
MEDPLIIFSYHLEHRELASRAYRWERSDVL